MIAIIGGGISGLAAALRLHEAGVPFLLIEAESRLGGKILTERVGGFIVEGGPDCFLASKPDGAALVRRLGLEARLCSTDPTHRGTYVRRNGRLHRLPEGLSGLVPTRVGPLLSTRVLTPLGRLRATLEPFIKAGERNADETIASFARRRFGREAYDWLIEPLLSGIYAGDGEQLSLAATFPLLAELERHEGSVLRAMARRRSGTAGFVTLLRGMAEMVEVLTRRLPGEQLLLGSAVVALEPRGAAFQIELAHGPAVAADGVILAVPAPVAARLADHIDRALGDELRGIPFVSTATVSLGYAPGSLRQPLRGYGFLSPRAAGGAIVAGTWTSNKFPSRVPGGATLVRFFVGRAGAERTLEQPDDALIHLARSEMARIAAVSATPALARVFRWPQSMPQYVVGHRARLDRIAQLVARHPGLSLVGASYSGVGIPDCIASGWTAAGDAMAQIGAAA
ncbi:MAG TPA: protoporphyrinogen oxidase [Gemmatimonadales bacterium]|nr:protoporphyrinogen oxidase [Gemmatimonadales bacterium]